MGAWGDVNSYGTVHVHYVVQVFNVYRMGCKVRDGKKADDRAMLRLLLTNL